MANKQMCRFSVPCSMPQNPHCTTLTIRKSKFLAQACRCDSREQARAFIEAMRAKNATATHNCWAYVAGPPGDTAHVGCNDDGEPHGTAGKPMLTALLHCGIGQICVVVSRWFGGIKLGTGGLARAYQQAVLENLESLAVECAAPKGSWQLEAGYELLAQVKKLLPQHEATLVQEEYGTEAKLLITAPLDKSERLGQALADLSSGRILLTPCNKAQA